MAAANTEIISQIMDRIVTRQNERSRALLSPGLGPLSTTLDPPSLPLSLPSLDIRMKATYKPG